jgi:hypothetical protein
MFVPKLVSSYPHAVLVQGLNVDLRELAVRKTWLLSQCQLHGLVVFLIRL